MDGEFKWYVAHTYSGYENKVKANLEKTVENRKLHHLIEDIRIPLEEVVEQKDDEKKVVTRKVFPGYVFIKMVMTNESWYIVRNTRGCTGFVGPGSKPVPLTDKEISALGVEKIVVNVDFNVGDTVRVTEGSMEGFMGEVLSIDTEHGTANILVTMFGGREMQVEFDFNQIELLD